MAVHWYSLPHATITYPSHLYHGTGIDRNRLIYIITLFIESELETPGTNKAVKQSEDVDQRLTVAEIL